jgi:hypothetical protein
MSDDKTKAPESKPVKSTVAVSLVGNSRGHKHGDVLEVSPTEAERLVVAKLAKPVA